MIFRYCPLCGHELIEKELDHRPRKVCPVCDYVQYRNPLPAAAVIVPQDDRVLLVRRKYEPRAGAWSLPAGFMEIDESPVEAAVRETREETGLEVAVVRLYDVIGTCDDPRSHVILVVYLAEQLGGELRPGDDASEARFFLLKALPAEIAFEGHRRVLQAFIAERENSKGVC